MRRFSRAVLAAGLLLLSDPLTVCAKPAPRRPDPLRIRRIRVIRRQLFDTKIQSENKKIFRFVNALHVSTKESAIREQLLLKEGDLYNADLAKESERAVRSVLKLRNVRVAPIPINKKTVDVLVSAQETWTTEPQLGFNGVGENLNFKAGIREQNLAGYGKDASFYYKKTDGIISRTFSYDDPRLLGKPLTMKADLQDREDGAVRSVSVLKPFLASVTRWSAGAGYADDKHEVKVLDNMGVQTDTLKSVSRNASLDLGVSARSTTRFIRRPRVGYRRLQDDLFHASPKTPIHQELHHVFRAGLHLEKVNFLTVSHIEQYDRDEDFSLGPVFDFEMGAARRKWVRTSGNANFFTGEFRQGWSHGASNFTLVKLDGSGKYQRDRWRSAKTAADVSYFDHFQPRQTFVAHLAWENIVNPTPGDQLFLGGDTGLRGYKLNQFVGNKKLLGNLEDRFFIVDDVLRFMSVGWVVFTDAGYVWAPGRSMRFGDIKMDVGTGMRLYLNRTSRGHVLRFDLAYALKRAGQQNRLVFTFGTSQAF